MTDSESKSDCAVREKDSSCHNGVFIMRIDAENSLHHKGIALYTYLESVKTMSIENDSTEVLCGK